MRGLEEWWRAKERRSARSKRWALGDEPWPAPEDLVECGGQLILAVGFTSAGFPYGSTVAGFREASVRQDSNKGWARAREAMRRAVRSLGLPEPEFGRVRKVGESLLRDVFAAEVDPGVDGWPKPLVALVPRRSAPGPRLWDVEREARLLTFLAERELSFRIPGLAIAVSVGGGSVLVCEDLAGFPLDLLAGRVPSIRPWDTVGRIAAEVHGIPLGELPWLDGHATRREHGEALVDELSDQEDAHDPDVRAGLSWVRAHLPPSEPSSLVHGNLLGQNLLIHPEEPMTVVGWGRALRGDPAFDLAIVTFGVRRPFQIDGGMRRLIETYCGAGGREVSEEQVRFHEICLHLRWYRSALAGEPGVESAESILARLRNVVRAVGARSAGVGRR